MKYLIKKARIVTPSSTSQRKDILIENGRIVKISKSISENKATIITSKNIHVCIGFCDIGTHIGEPGYEERETIQSISESAANGGYTCLAPFPNLNPVIDNKSSIRFLQTEFERSIVHIMPIGAISKNCEGENISEMMDMHHHGAIAFSDGMKSIQDTGLLLRTLLYTKATNSLVIHHPEDNALTSDAQMHEGQVSTSLGLSGNPEESEIIMVKRDIDLSNYAESKICLHNISSGSSIELIKKAKAKKNHLFCSVPFMNLLHSDEDLREFNTKFKVNPPLRTHHDKKLLIKGIINNTIDYIASNHTPIDLEHKDLEFYRSSFGASTLDTVFSSLLTVSDDKMTLNKIIEKLAYGSRHVLGISIPKIEENELAELCVFDPTLKWTVSSSKIFSKSKNNPYIGGELQGKILAIFNKKQIVIHN
jgi:dihydroorotase